MQNEISSFLVVFLYIYWAIMHILKTVYGN